MLWRQTHVVGPLGCNCTLLGDPERGEAIAIDPGDAAADLARHLGDAGMRLVAIVHTHAHIDHIGASWDLAAQCPAPTYLHPLDAPLHQALDLQAQLLGLAPVRWGAIDRPLKDGMALDVGRFSLEVLHTPGHSPGSVSFHLAGANLCFTGDTLFAGGIGRTDLWGGDAGHLQRSIRERLYVLQDDVEVVPGHGPITTIAAERRGNPFVRSP